MHHYVIRIIAGLFCVVFAVSACMRNGHATDTLTLGGVTLTIPDRYIAEGRTLPFMPAAGDLDQQAEVFVKLPAADLGVSREFSGPSSQAEILARLAVAGESPEVPRDAADAWLGRGLYEDRVVEEDAAAGGLVRVYPESGYPVLWHFFKDAPHEPTGPLASQPGAWVASCRISPNATVSAIESAHCLTLMRWKTILVEIRFPGLLIQDISILREHLAGKLRDWSAAARE